MGWVQQLSLYDGAFVLACLHGRAELSVGWVDPWVGLGWVGLGRNFFSVFGELD